MLIDSLDLIYETEKWLAELRHSTTQFCYFWCRQLGNSCLCNRGFRKVDVVQTNPVEVSASR